MENVVIDRFTSVEEIRIQLPKENREEWLTEIICTNSSGSRVKLLLASVDSYASIWALTHDFEEMELIDLYEGSTQYEFGRFELRIRNDAHVNKQWFKNASITEI